MITLTGNPISTQNAYGQHGKIRYLKAEARAMKEQYQWEARSQWKGKVLDGDMSIEVHLYFKDKRIRDWDNWHKISMDALTDIVWKDDHQIQDAHVFKHIDKQNPRIEIIIINYKTLCQK